MGEQPHDVPLVEVVALHDLDAVALDALQEHELVHAAFADDAGEEGQRQFAHRVEPDEPADARIHVFDGNGGVAAAEGVDPALGLDGIGHGLGGLADVGDLGLLDAVHDRAGVIEPLLSDIAHIRRRSGGVME